jgi:O-antigen/teichoic acid export membrane protein
VPPMSISALSRIRSIQFGTTFKRVLEAASLTVAAQILSQILRLGGSLIMTRLLAPEAFGLMSLVLMIQITLNLLSDFGLRLAVIQHQRGDDPVLLNTVWTVQVLRGIAGWIVCCAIAYGLHLANSADPDAARTAWAHPDLPMVLAITSLTFVIGGFQSTNHITASRHLALRRIIAIDLICQILGLLIMIGLGFITRSIWAIVASGILSTLANTALSHIVLPGIRNHFALDRHVIRELFHFGIWIIASSTTFVLAVNADRALLGALASATTLGLYSIAQTLSFAIDGILSRLVEGVILPTLSEASRESRSKLRDRLSKIKLPFDVLYVGCAGCLFAIGPHIVALLYDARYHEAGTMLQILSFSLIFSRYSVFNAAYVAMGNPRFQAIVNTARLASVILLLPLLFHFYGLTGALIAIAFHQAVLLPVYCWINYKTGIGNIKSELLALPIWLSGYIGAIAILNIIRFIGAPI